MDFLESNTAEWIQLEHERMIELRRRCGKSKYLDKKSLNWIGSFTITEVHDTTSADGFYNASSKGLIGVALFEDNYVAILGESDIGIGVRFINEYLQDGDKVVCFSRQELELLKKRNNKNIEIILNEY